MSLYELRVGVGFGFFIFNLRKETSWWRTWASHRLEDDLQRSSKSGAHAIVPVTVPTTVRMRPPVHPNASAFMEETSWCHIYPVVLSWGSLYIRQQERRWGEGRTRQDWLEAQISLADGTEAEEDDVNGVRRKKLRSSH